MLLYGSKSLFPSYSASPVTQSSHVHTGDDQASMPPLLLPDLTHMLPNLVLVALLENNHLLFEFDIFCHKEIHWLAPSTKSSPNCQSQGCH